MKFTLYKPNQKNTGAAFSFEVGKSKNGDAALYVSMIQQYSWNDSTKNGSFKENAKNPDKSASIKLNVIEAGEFLSSFKNRIPFVSFHKSNDDTTIIKLNPWDKDRKIKEQGGETSYKTPAFGITVSRNSSQVFKLPLEAGEVEVLSRLLQQYIDASFLVEKKQYQTQGQPQSGGQSYKKKPVVEEEAEDDAPF